MIFRLSEDGTVLADGDTLDFGFITVDGTTVNDDSIPHELLIQLAKNQIYRGGHLSAEISEGDPDFVQLELRAPTNPENLVANGSCTETLTFIGPEGAEILSLNLTSEIQKTGGHLYLQANGGSFGTSTAVRAYAYDESNTEVMAALFGDLNAINYPSGPAVAGGGTELRYPLGGYSISGGEDSCSDASLHSRVENGAYSYIYIDTDNGLNLGPWPHDWDVDIGEYQLTLSNIDVTDGTIQVDGNDFSQVGS